MTARLQIGDKALVTTQGWFYAPDGKQYRAVFGTVHAIERAADTLGVAPPRPHTTWYLRIGNMTIAGCQVLYAVRTDVCELGKVKDPPDGSEEGKAGTSYSTHAERMSAIYNADRLEAL